MWKLLGKETRSLSTVNWAIVVCWAFKAHFRHSFTFEIERNFFFLLTFLKPKKKKKMMKKQKKRSKASENGVMGDCIGNSLFLRPQTNL